METPALPPVREVPGARPVKAGERVLDGVDRKEEATVPDSYSRPLAVERLRLEGPGAAPPEKPGAW